MFMKSSEVEDVGLISLDGVKIEHGATTETIFGVCSRTVCREILTGAPGQKPLVFALFTAANSYAFAAANAKELQSWIVKLDPTGTS
jgi:kinesin family protein 1